ncbi:hypothetical protein D3C86_961610 [compost metagenome]
MFGDDEAVVGGHHDLHAGAGLVGARIGDQHAVGLLGSSADPAAQLVELREAEALGVFDDHHRGIGDVHADLDDRGRDEDVQLAVAEGRNYLIL